MTVQELIEALSKETPEYEVVFGFNRDPVEEVYPIHLVYGDPLATEEHSHHVVIVGSYKHQRDTRITHGEKL